MLIRYGYDITVTCTVPTPMVSLLSAHGERGQDIRQPEQWVATPPVASRSYLDLYGNLCRRFVAPQAICRCGPTGPSRTAAVLIRSGPMPARCPWRRCRMIA